MELLCRSLLCWLYHWVGASHQNLKMDLFEHSIPQTASQAYHGSKTSNTTGWWFGTCFIFPYIGNSNPKWPNWLIFVKMVKTTNQYHVPTNISILEPNFEVNPSAVGLPMRAAKLRPRHVAGLSSTSVPGTSGRSRGWSYNNQRIIPESTNVWMCVLLLITSILIII